MTNTLKLTDFGTSKQVEEEMAKTKIGTPYYQAPSMLIEGGYNPFITDLWSMGIFLFELATGRVPYNARNRKELAKVIAKRKLSYPREISVSLVVKDLIEKIIKEGSIDFDQMVAHPFVAATEAEYKVYIDEERSISLSKKKLEN